MRSFFWAIILVFLAIGAASAEDNTNTDRRLIAPLTVTRGENAMRIAVLYEYCRGMPDGSDYVLLYQNKNYQKSLAGDIAKMLRLANESDAAKFYENCAKTP